MGLARVRFEILQPPWLENNSSSHRITRAALGGLRAAGFDVEAVASPTAAANRVVIWGLGHPKAQALLRSLVPAGITVIGWDVGYWRRGLCFRVSFNDAHPRQYVMAKARPPDRLLADGITLREDADPDGPVLLIGIGRKSAATYDEQPGEWEDRALAKIRAAWPDRRVIFRPKRGGGSHAPAGAPIAASGPIEALLRGAAAVYCRHSNVAVDAIIAGIPAIAEDGAAAAVCENAASPGRLPAPLPREVRLAFLGNLAWFQWSEEEIERRACWWAIEDIIRSVSL